MGELPIKAEQGRWLNLTLIAAFGCFLWLPTADNLFHLDHTTAFNEKRMPAAFPTFKPSLSGIQDYLKGLEAYFNDHFGWRKQLIRWHGAVEVAIFHKKIATDVVWGRDGWLYYYPQQTGDDPVTRRTKHFSPQELESLRHILECRRDWLACRGIAYLFVVAPNKQSIYPEYLPSWLRAGDAPTRLDQFLSYMRSHSSVPILDLRLRLQRAKQLAPTYYRTDSHWNSFGGYVASEEIVCALSRQIPDLRPVPLESFRLTRSPVKGGDLTEVLGICAEDEAVTLSPGPAVPNIKETVSDPSLVKPSFFTTNASASATAVIFRDSFGTALRPFLAYSFRNVSFIWTAKDFDARVVEQIKPDVVVSQIAERNLDGLAKWD